MYRRTVSDRMERLLAEALQPSLKKVVERVTKLAAKTLNDSFEAQGFALRVQPTFETDPGRGGYGPWEIGTIQIGTLRLRVIGTYKDNSVSTGVSSGANTLESYHSKGPVTGADARVKDVAERLAKLASPEVKKAEGAKPASKPSASKPSEVKTQPVQDSQTAEFVAQLLNGRRTKVGGRLKVQDVEKDYVSLEPYYRSRLDHYGNDGEGWDEEGWVANYAGPLQAEVQAVLKTGGATQWEVEVGDKGHVDVYWVSK